MSIFESQESIKKRAAETVNNAFDPNFSEKFEKVKPFLDQKALNEELKKVAERREREGKTLAQIRKALGIPNKNPDTIPVLEKSSGQAIEAPAEPAPVTVPGNQPKATWEIERDMFKPENIKARAMNRVEVMKNSKDYKPENVHWSEKAKNILKNLDNWKGFGK